MKQVDLVYLINRDSGFLTHLEVKYVEIQKCQKFGRSAENRRQKNVRIFSI